MLLNGVLESLQTLAGEQQIQRPADVCVVHVPQLDQVLRALVTAEINIEFAYSLMIRPRGKAVLAINCQEEDFACEVMRRLGFMVLSQSDISR